MNRNNTTSPSNGESKSKQQFIALNWLLEINKQKMTRDEINILKGLLADLLHKVHGELNE